jgi:hypothetical protein
VFYTKLALAQCTMHVVTSLSRWFTRDLRLLLT